MTVQEKAHKLINEFYKVWQSGVLQEFQTDKDIISALETIQANSGILRNDRILANLTSTAFLFGVFVASKENISTPVSISEQEQAVRCLKCDKVDYSNGSFRCKLSKCKYD
jgi:hypothetical protein